MSLLTPLYALGLLAISLPVVFHLIRRTPKGQFPFSSLMFLRPSPPRLTRRSRLEHLLLLLLRATAVALLAFAFARPFWRETTPADRADGDRRRVAVVVDTSASMRRGDLWQQANREVAAVLKEIRPVDQIAVYTCDDALHSLARFEELAQIPAGERLALIRQRLADLSPTWAGTQLGRGLMDIVDIVANVPEGRDTPTTVAKTIVLISDLQEGSRIDVLADYAWPDDVRLDLRPVVLKQPTNAGLHWLADRSGREPNARPHDLRVRISNDAASAVDEFRLMWIGQNDKPLDVPMTAYVPAGESRVIRVPRLTAAEKFQRLQLSGDGCDFDNTLHLASRPETEMSVMYLGAVVADDPGTPRYYLERALANGLSRPVELVAASNENLRLGSAATVPLVVVTSQPTDEQTAELQGYAEAGGTVLLVLMENGKQSRAASKLLGVPAVEITEAPVPKYAMLGQIAFDHPLFAAMAGPHFNDFTQIHFWKYRELKKEQLGGATIVARFENGDPALVERRLGKGQVYVLASGWQPSDSQLARSWKFVLLVSALVEGRHPGMSDRLYYVINEPVPLGEAPDSASHRVITKPDGKKVSLTSDARDFRGTDQPGVYLIESQAPFSPKLEDKNPSGNSNGRFGESTRQEAFAVNLDPAESRTSPLAVETLEQLGCRLVSPAAVAENKRRDEQLRDVQLESRQKLWQWLIVAALAVLVGETWLAGRTTKQSQAKEVFA